MSKRTLVIASVALLLVIAAPVFAYVFITRPLPRLDGTEPLSGLDQPVSVSFDGRGVPYIEARTDNDAYTAQGYITARDRIFQMDMLRRTAEGQMSEVFGSSWLATDRLMRTIGLKRLAFAELDKLTPASRAALESYARGVNTYLATTNALPLQFTFLGYTPRTWSAEDSLAVLKLQAYRIDEPWRLDDFRQRVHNLVGDEIAKQLFRDDLIAFGLPGKSSDQKEEPATEQKEKKDEKEKEPPPPTNHKPSAWLAPVDQLLSGIDRLAQAAQTPLHTSPLLGSTTWAIPGQATSTHGAMLACNSDGPLLFPAEYYLCSLNSPGMHVAGCTLPGVPCVLIGRNENMGWGYSALKSDTQDIFLEQFDSDFGSKYKDGADWKDADVQTELIPVRFGNDVEHKIITTGHGPVLLRNKQAGVSLAWTGFETDKPSFDAVYRLNRSTSTDEFVSALSKFSDPGLLFVFADRFGNAGCHAAGNVPVRAAGGTGEMLNVGWEAKGKWTGMVPFDKLPHAIVTASASAAASRSAVIAANQAPANNDSALPAGSPTVQLGHQWAPPYRANRLLSALSDPQSPITPADMIALAGDQRSSLASVLADALQQAAQATHLADRNGLYAIEMLSHWDTDLRADGIEASIYQCYMQTFARRLLEPKLGRAMTSEYLQRWPLWLTFAQSVLQNTPEQWLPPEERTYDCFLMTTLSQALKSLHISFESSSPAQWVWGKTHQATFAPLGGASNWMSSLYKLGPVAVGGGPECINSCDVSFDPSMLRYAAAYGPTQRTIMDMSDHAKFYQSICTGQSGQLTSPNRQDQLKAWAAVDLLPIAFSPDQLMKQTAHKLTLENQ